MALWRNVIPQSSGQSITKRMKTLAMRIRILSTHEGSRTMLKKCVTFRRVDDPFFVLFTPFMCSQTQSECFHITNNSVALVRARTERPSLVGEVSVKFLRIEGWRVVSVTNSYGRILGFLNRSRYFFFQVAPQLYSRGWVDPVPDPLLLRKSGSTGNRTRTSGSVARNCNH
jgi:hypothetical protein